MSSDRGLPTEVTRRILSYTDISGLLNAADISIEWRKLAEDKGSLDGYATHRFGLTLDELPNPTRYEKLLIDTQRLTSRPPYSQFLESPKDLMKIYSMELRSSWYPYGFVGGYASPLENIQARELKYPWPYGNGDDEASFFEKYKALSAKFHAAFPKLFDALLYGSLAYDQRPTGKLSFVTDPSSYAEIVRKLGDQLGTDGGDVGCNNGGPDGDSSTTIHHPKAFELQTNQGRFLDFIFYEGYWRVFYTHAHVDVVVPEGDAPPGSPPISYSATPAEIRQRASAVVDQFVKATYEQPHRIACPEFGVLLATRSKIHQYQIDLVKYLDEIIDSVASLLNKEVRRLMESQCRNSGNDWQKLTEFVDALTRCPVGHEGCAQIKGTSTHSFINALTGAIRRRVNATFVPDVNGYFNDPCSFQLVHAWSWQGCGQSKRLCFDKDRPADFDHSQCYMKRFVVFGRLCTSQGNPELWPAVTLKRAIGQVPELASELRRMIEKHVEKS